MTLIFDHPVFSNDKWRISCVETTAVTEHLTKIVDTYLVELPDLEEDATLAEVEAAATAIIQAQ